MHTKVIFDRDYYTDKWNVFIEKDGRRYYPKTVIEEMGIMKFIHHAKKNNMKIIFQHWEHHYRRYMKNPSIFPKNIKRLPVTREY